MFSSFVGHAYSVLVLASLFSIFSAWYLGCLISSGVSLLGYPNSPFSCKLPVLTFKPESWKPALGYSLVLTLLPSVFLFPYYYHRLDLSTMALTHGTQLVPPRDLLMLTIFKLSSQVTLAVWILSPPGPGCHILGNLPCALQPRLGQSPPLGAA